MAGGGFAAAGGGSARDYGGGITFSVVVTSLMAASCGLISGYDSGVTGAYSTTATGHGYSFLSCSQPCSMIISTSLQACGLQKNSFMFKAELFLITSPQGIKTVFSFRYLFYLVPL